MSKSDTSMALEILHTALLNRTTKHLHYPNNVSALLII